MSGSTTQDGIGPVPPGMSEKTPAGKIGAFGPTWPFGAASAPFPGIPMLYPQEFDVIVVGGGHAGTEAALAAAGMG